MRKLIIICSAICFFKSSASQTFKTTSPDNIKLITTDISNFWNMFDRLQKAKTLKDTLEIIKKYYLDKASYGLQQYIKASNSTSTDFGNAIKNHNHYLLSIRNTTTSIQNYKYEIIDAAKKLQSIYPPSTFPQIYFAMGKFEVGGSKFVNFIYIGAELMCSSPNSPLSEIPEDLRPSIVNIQDVALISIHEIVHYQQKYQDAKNILEQALIEGGADFITEKIIGKITAQSCFNYGVQHEKELWEDFKNQASTENYIKWFVNIKDSLNQRPGMLGYFIGYRICEEYFQNSSHKNSALAEIIEMKNPTEIFQKSKYAGESKNQSQ